VDAFDASATSRHELSILTGMDSSAYLITDEANQALAVRALTHTPREQWWLGEARVLLDYQKVRLAWRGHRFTIVPARLYNGDARQALLMNLTALSDQDTVLADPLPELDAFLVYALDQAQLTLWRRTFIGARFYHVATPLLHRLAALSRNQGRPQVYAYFHDGWMTTIGLERDQLRFCNTFRCPDTKDYLYYLLLTYEQCGWKPDLVPLYLLGEVMRDAAIYKQLYRYVRDIQFLTATEGVTFGGAMSEHPGHLFFDLSSLHAYH
jgi:hypothetical protein